MVDYMPMGDISVVRNIACNVKISFPMFLILSAKFLAMCAARQLDFQKKILDETSRTHTHRSGKGCGVDIVREQSEEKQGVVSI